MSRDQPDPAPSPPAPRTLTERLLGLILAAGIVFAGVALFGLMLTTDQNMIGIVASVLLGVTGVRQLVKVIKEWRAATTAAQHADPSTGDF